VGRKAEQFLSDLEFYAAQGDVDPLQWLPRAIAPGAQRTNWDAVCERKQAAGEVMTWPVAREAFKQMVGESEDRAADAALTALMDGSVCMTASMSVADYRTLFQDKLRLAPVLCEQVAVRYFLKGLPPALAAHCMGDAAGRPLTKLDDAFTCAEKAERIVKLSCPKPVAAVSHAASPLQKRPHGVHKRTADPNAMAKLPDGSTIYKCHACQQWGHKSYQCPNSGRSGGGGGRGGGRGGRGGRGGGRGGRSATVAAVTNA
jgi:uncharacterized membrane protein YgcG